MAWVPRAILEETKRVTDLSGRTARGPYLMLWLFWNSVFVLSALGLATFATGKSFWVALAIIAVPFTAVLVPAGLRRLHDVGEDSSVFFLPFQAFTVLGLIVASAVTGLAVKGWLYVLALLTVDLAQFDPLLAVLAFIFVGFFGTLIVGLAWIGMLLYWSAFSFGAFSHAMGSLLLPSQSGTNAYGPMPEAVRE